MSRPTAAALGLYLALTGAHLLAQVTGPETVEDLTQVALMPALAGLLVLAARAAGTRQDRLVRLTLLGLGFSWLGDSVPRLFPGDSDTGFLAMVGFFLLAQLAYATGFRPWAGAGLLGHHRGWLVPYLLAFVGLMAACLPHAGVLAVPVVIYGVCLLTTAVLATGVHPLTWAGCAVFLVSDGLIALGAFGPQAVRDLPAGDLAVMATYTAAQLLLVLGVLARARTSRDGGPLSPTGEGLDLAPAPGR